ncbi:hypothetical protein Y032_0006g2890 [Ancylostoma ceylanicum]|uniref:Uncharacterized protein n=1 Tax=Ancylostoma ceylanicum TaxID=53326 RepID=A0A016VPE2_9BILA|nr:hypothetical protein Y032_0006g2890 [Ancylostoma ceylanicum]
MEVIKIGTISRKQIFVKSGAAEDVLLSIFSSFLADLSQHSEVINSNRDTEEEASKSARLCITKSNRVAPGLPYGVGTDVLTQHKKGILDCVACVITERSSKPKNQGSGFLEAFCYSVFPCPS